MASSSTVATHMGPPDFCARRRVFAVDRQCLKLLVHKTGMLADGRGAWLVVRTGVFAAQVYETTKLTDLSRMQLAREVELHIHMDHANILRLYAAWQEGQQVSPPNCWPP